MRPSFLDNMSYAMAEVYGAVSDRIMINLAHHFQYYKNGAKLPGSFEYQARMLAQMGQVNRETLDIIQSSLGSADTALRAVLEASIMDALKNEEPALIKAAQQGLLMGGANIPAPVTPNQLQAFQSYYRQSADRLNLVNTAMLESTQAAYTATVSDVVQKINRTQSILNVGAGEVVTGVSSWNTAMHDAVRKMVQNGLTGFVDHGGHRWTPEAYVAMDIRTTMFNTARAAVWERADSYGADMYQVSIHNGARPLCYPWQGKVISRSGFSGMVEDLDGNKITVYPESATTKGQAAGLFGVNCRHYPMTFIPGFSTLKGEPQDPAENEKTYEESQEQRGLERKLREEKRELAILKAQGADEAAIKAQRDKVHKASDDIDEFCDATGRARRRNREFTPVNATWPHKDSYDVSLMPTKEREKLQDYYQYKGSPTRTYIYTDAVRSEERVVIEHGGGYKPTVIQADIYTMPDGMRFAFKKGMNKSHQTITPQKAIDYWYRIPQRLRDKAQKQLNVVDTYNPADAYFKKTYKNFTHSYATGGDVITLFRHDTPHNPQYFVEGMAYHEIGHYIDQNSGMNGVRYSLSGEWASAMAKDLKSSGKSSISAYGMNSPVEDFAESVKEYTSYRSAFLKTMPERGKILDRIIRNGGGSP